MSVTKYDEGRLMQVLVAPSSPKKRRMWPTDQRSDIQVLQDATSRDQAALN
jgi:hypothetical protein